MVPYDKIKITLRREIIKIEKKKYTPLSHPPFHPHLLLKQISVFVFTNLVRKSVLPSSLAAPSKQLSVYSCTIE
jgi:hypothetical protein